MRILAVAGLMVATSSIGPRPARGQPSGKARPILVVVPASSTLNSVTVESLRRIFLGEAPDLRPLNLPPGSEERIAFDRAVFGLGPEEAARFWIDRRIRGQRGSPKVIPSGRLVGRIVARVPGSIGYLVDGPPPPGVKVIRIGGLPPDHPRYPLLVKPGAR